MTGQGYISRRGLTKTTCGIIQYTAFQSRTRLNVNNPRRQPGVRLSLWLLAPTGRYTISYSIQTMQNVEKRTTPYKKCLDPFIAYFYICEHYLFLRSICRPFGALELRGHSTPGWSRGLFTSGSFRAGYKNNIIHSASQNFISHGNPQIEFAPGDPLNSGN